jgi:hypothetical protein
MTEPRGFAWVLNLDAELELEKPSFNARTRFLEQLALYGAGSRALLGPGDVLLGDEEAGPDVAGRLGRAWCPTPRALSRMRAARVTPEPHPPVEVLRSVNHRRFAVELGGGLPDQHYVERRPELEALLTRREHPWLLKRPLAFAGRGQQRAYGSLDEKQWSWVDASFKVSGLVVEPLVTPVLEVSLHGFIWRDRRHELGRVCVQEVSDRGVFRAIRLAQPGELTSAEEDALRRRGAKVANALAAAGYFGPFGIDAYRYTLNGVCGFCELGEINARYSMGFVTGFPVHPSELSLDS